MESCHVSIRDLAKPSILHSIGNGENTLFWIGPLIRPVFILKDHFGSRTIYNMGLAESVEVSNFINNGIWNLPSPSSAEMSDILDLITQIHLLCTQRRTLLSGLLKKGTCSISLSGPSKS